MVNDVLHGERTVDEPPPARARRAFIGSSMAAGTTAAMTAAVTAAKTAAFITRISLKIAIVPILVKYATNSLQVFVKVAQRGEPRFQTSCLWSRSGNKNTRGDAGVKRMKRAGPCFSLSEWASG
jgi:hypothetical protein